MPAAREDRVGDLDALMRRADVMAAQHLGQVISCVFVSNHELILNQPLDSV